jgi:competence protein ComFB
MKIVNVMESLVEQKLDEVIDTFDCCKCEQCRADIISYALNRLSPKYANTDLGRAYMKLDATSTQFEIDLLAALYEAAEKVKKNPRHRL